MVGRLEPGLDDVMVDEVAARRRRRRRSAGVRSSISFRPANGGVGARAAGRARRSARRRRGREDRVEDVLVGVGERVAGDVAAPVGALEVDRSLAVRSIRPRTSAAERALDADRRRADVGPPSHVPRPSSSPHSATNRSIGLRKATSRPRAARSISGASDRVATMSASSRTITSAGCASGATVFSSHGGVAPGAATSVASRLEQLALLGGQPAVEHEDRLARGRPGAAS